MKKCPVCKELLWREFEDSTIHTCVNGHYYSQGDKYRTIIMIGEKVFVFYTNESNTKKRKRAVVMQSRIRKARKQYLNQKALNEKWLAKQGLR